MQSTKSLLVVAALAWPAASAVAQEHEHMQMEMQPGADRMKVSVRSPSAGSKVTGDKVTLQVATTGFTNRCDLAGKPVQRGAGHYHVLLDKSLVDMYCGDQATVSLLYAGSNALIVAPLAVAATVGEPPGSTTQVD